MGGPWYMPTVADWQELIDNCQWTWTSEQGVTGYRVSRNGKSIFLHACGMCNGMEAPETFMNEGDSVRYDGLYWSGTLSGKNNPGNEASYLRFNTGYQRMNLPYITSAYELYLGMSVRPVAKIQETQR
jgi:hypothetical protein